MIHISLYNDFVGKVGYSLSYTSGSGKIDFTVVGNIHCLENSYIYLTHKAIGHTTEFNARNVA
jgi:hypothetical protein